MTDLRKAAEELIEAWDWDCSEPRNKVLRDLIEDLRQALAQPEKKMRIEGSGKLTTKPYPDSYESEQEFREALTQWDGFVYSGDRSYRLSPSTGSFGIGDLPAKRKWVGLTDEESIKLLQKAAKHKSPDYCTAPEMAVEFGRLASEALKEKNSGYETK